MKTPWTEDDLNLLRERPQPRSTWYMAVHKPASILVGSLASAPETYPVSALNFNHLAGANACQVGKNYTLRIGSTSPRGYEKGIVRVREQPTEDSSKIEIMESGCGLIKFEKGDYLNVVEQLLPWSIHPRYDSAASEWLMDYDNSYASELDEYGPLVIMGPPVAGFNDNLDFSASFVGASSKFLGADSSRAQWREPSFGAPDEWTSFGTESDPIVMSFSAVGNTHRWGRYVHLDVWDENENMHSGHRPVWVFEDRTQPFRVSFGNITGGLLDGGYEATLEVFPSDHDASVLEDLSEVLIFEEVEYATGSSTITGGNYPFRDNVVMRGWILQDTVRINPFDNSATVRIGTVDKLMRQTYSKDLFLADRVTEAAGDSTDWVFAASLSIDKAAYQLLKYRSQVSEMVDFYPASINGTGVTASSGLTLFQDLNEGSLWDQLTQNYTQKGIRGYVAADLHSNLWATEDVQISGGSDNFAQIMDITYRDRRDQIVIDETPLAQAAETHMLSVSSDTPNWAMIPGDVAGYYGKKVEHSKGLFVNQDTLVKWVGNFHAKLNNKHKRVVVPLAGHLRLDPVPISTVTMSLSAADNLKGINWDNQVFIPNKLNLEYDPVAGAVKSTIEMEKVVDGHPGSAVTFPSITAVG